MSVIIDCAERNGVFVPVAVGRWSRASVLLIDSTGMRQFQAPGWHWSPLPSKENERANAASR